jgi:micrococcal nuclease
MESKPRAALVLHLLAFSIAGSGGAADRISGPVEAEILRVIDGDTILVSAKPWPQQSVEVYVRLRGIDTPELRSRCPEHREAARSARDLLTSLASDGIRIALSDIEGDKFFGRVVADVRLADGTNPAHHLLEAGLGVAYDGGRKASTTCMVSLEH